MVEHLEPYNFKPGESGNPNGRPRKWVSTLGAQGYKKSEIVDAIEVLCSMSMEELQKVSDNEDNTILERTVAKALILGNTKGSLYNLETLITRVHGQPKQDIEQTTNIKGDINITMKID